MSVNNSSSNIPSSSIATLSLVENLKIISDVQEIIQKQTVETAEMLFGYLINIEDKYIMTGTIPEIVDENLAKEKRSQINECLKMLNRLFKFSRQNLNSGEFRIINRNMIKDMDKKTYAICICYEGGVYLDILCDVVNAENNARAPSRSPKVTIATRFTDKENTLGK
ncbi:MAG: hypothetical protein SFV53_05595 [Rickettsiales bacterium]|nr:hypothetical protein [Rickettsiales bacterium]